MILVSTKIEYTHRRDRLYAYFYFFLWWMNEWEIHSLVGAPFINTQNHVHLQQTSKQSGLWVSFCKTKQYMDQFDDKITNNHILT